MSYTYPPGAPSLSGDTLSIHRLLQSPTLIGRRLRTLLEQRYIADAILKGRFNVEGGAITYETGEPIGTDANPRAVAPGAEYPLVKLAGGTASLAKTTKWGQDALVLDEAIKRLKRNPVDRAFTKLANQSVKNVDSVAMSAITSAVTASAAAAASWATASAEQILTDVMLAKANIIALNEGYMPDTVVIDDINFARAMAKFVAAGYLPREAVNGPLVTGDFPDLQGMTWLASPNAISGTVLVADTEQLGGMADESLGGPGYVKVDGVGVETKSIRDDDVDGYKLRARRVTVPVVLEPAAGRKITGV